MYQVFFIDPFKEAGSVECNTLNEALRWAKELRENGNRFVTIASENPNSVGEQGVDGVQDGMLPDGTPYTWKKRRS
jgi:hypothetical protein